MAVVSSPVTTAASTTDTILQTLFNVALPLAKAAEVAALPFLGWPVISQLFDALQNWIANDIRIALSLQATYLIIDFETTEEKDAFQAAVVQLRAAVAKGNLNDPDLIAKAKALDQSFEKLVHSDGSFSPQ